MDHAKRGAAALAASNATAAVEAYTQALIEHSTSPDYFTQRSVSFSRLKPPRHDLALKDADYGVLCGQKRGKRDKMQAAQQRRVICLYNMGQYADAKFVLESMKKWRPKDSKPQEMEHNMWMAKIDNKLKLGAQEKTITEYPSEALPDEKILKKLLRNQLKADGTFNFDGEGNDKEMAYTETTAETSTTQSNGTSSTSTATTASAPPQKVRHEWYQNNQSVIITLYAKGVKENTVDVELNDDSIFVSFPNPADTSSTYTFTLDPLFALIDPSTSKSKVMSTKLELTLTKALPGQKWANIEGTVPLKNPDTVTTSSIDHAKAAILTALHQNASHNPSTATPAPTTSSQQTAPSYPTSSRHGSKNWDKLANDLTAKKSKKKDKKQEDKDGDSDSASEVEDDYESDTGGDAVDGFFKKLYKNADDDTRKAMMKSFQESNGTALSTNWSEVSKGKVEEVKGKDDN